MKHLYIALFLAFLGCVSFAFSDRVINGTVENPLEYRRVVQLYRNGSTFCTGSLIGPRTILTAGHCVKSGLSIRMDNVVLPLTMNRHPKFKTIGAQFDYAIGILPVEVKGPYMTIGTLVTKGDTVNIYGFGCWVNGKYDGKLRSGVSKVSGFSGTDFTTATGSALCYGDSGGPTVIQGTNWQVGVNSKGNISTKSWFADVTRKEFKDWARTIAETNKTHICGITMDCP